MADSLQDQLLALGLAKDKPGKQKKKRPRKPARQSPQAGKASGELSLDKAWALREKEEKRSAEQKRARKIEEDRKRREINKAIKAIVDPHRLNQADAEVARNFLYRDRIRKLYVTPEQNKSLASGELGLVYLSGGYHLLAAEHIEAVRKIDAGHVVDLGGDEPQEEEFPVPDDLVW